MWSLTKIRKLTDKFVRNGEGHIAVVTALIGVPLVMIAGYAVDYNQAHRHRIGIMAALDTAVLAAVIPANLNDDERAAYAQKIFDDNYVDKIPVNLSINATSGRVDIKAIGTVPTLVGGIIGQDEIDVQESSAAVLTTSDVVCALALDPTGDGAIEFLDDARFSAQECSVQANSSSSQAMISNSSHIPNAKSFCVNGISSGRFSPFVKNACSPISDPYADLVISPINTDSRFASAFASYCHNLEMILSLNQLIQNSGFAEDVIGDNAILPPGNYCNGLRLAGMNIVFLPGVYNISGGNFHLESFASARGDRVTFVLDGASAGLIIETGAQASFVAPESGDYGGLVFYQKPALGTSTANYPDRTSMIGSGGGLNITGTAYFPTQELIITSDQPVASQAPATSFIAYRLKFAGQSNTEIHVDHETGGIPPLLPRSDEGARLVRYEETPDNQNCREDSDECEDD